MRRLVIGILSAALLICLIGCLDDDGVLEPSELTVLEVTASGTVISGGGDTTVVILASNDSIEIPYDARFIITYSKILSQGTSDLSNFTIERLDGDGGQIDYTSAVSGSSLTIEPTAVMPRSAVMRFSSADSVVALDGGVSTGIIDYVLYTSGVPLITPPQEDHQVLYFEMNDDFGLPTGTLNINDISITPTSDRNHFAKSAFLFDGNNSIVDYTLTEALDGRFFTISLWMKLDATGHTNNLRDTTIQSGHMVMGMGGADGFYLRASPGLDTLTFAASYVLPDDRVVFDRFAYTGQGEEDNGPEVLINEILVDSTLDVLLQQIWTHVLVTYDGGSNERALYLNGQLMRKEDLDLTVHLAEASALSLAPPAGVGLKDFPMTFGFAFADLDSIWFDSIPFSDPNADHLKGSLDEVRIFDVTFGQEEVESLYLLEKP